jgi:hypothetical protein
MIPFLPLGLGHQIYRQVSPQINLADLYDAEAKFRANMPFIPSSVNRDFPNFAREKPEFAKMFSWVKGKAVKKILTVESPTSRPVRVKS